MKAVLLHAKRYVFDEVYKAQVVEELGDTKIKTDSERMIEVEIVNAGDFPCWLVGKLNLSGDNNGTAIYRQSHHGWGSPHFQCCVSGT